MLCARTSQVRTYGAAAELDAPWRHGTRAWARAHVPTRFAAGYTADAGVLAAEAVAREDIAGLTKIPGLGKKTAARLCIDLKDKLDRFLVPEGLGSTAVLASSSEPQALEDSRAALAALGYNAREIKKALAAASPSDDDTVQSILKRALKALSPS